MDSEQRRVKKLFLAFKRSIIHGDIPTEFDESDLIDIYDYATDSNDEYVQMMVLLSAARMYPDSPEIAQRRGYYFYEHMPLSEGAEALAAAHNNETPLWTILKELLNSPDERNPQLMMDYILSNFSDYDDETIIQMIDACIYLGIFDWLKEHKSEIQNKCMYPETFLYELAQEADSSGDTEFALKVLEELTNLVPFNSSYWYMLSQCYLVLGDYENSLNAIDYALAIDPKSVEMRIRRVHLVFLIDGNRKEAERKMLDIISEYPDNLNAVFAYVSMLIMDNQREVAAEILLRYVQAAPENRDLVNNMINLELKDFSAKALDIYYDKVSKDATEWMTWAANYFDAGQYRQCADILLAYVRNDISRLSRYDYLLESLYMCSEFDEICKIYDDMITTGSINSINLSSMEALYMVLSMMRTGRTEDARNLAARQLLAIRDMSPLSNKERIIEEGMREMFDKILYVIDENQKVDIDDIDPFI